MRSICFVERVTEAQAAKKLDVTQAGGDSPVHPAPHAQALPEGP
jgi:hypothetical protein